VKPRGTVRAIGMSPLMTWSGLLRKGITTSAARVRVEAIRVT
jgi:hypothetical protein